MIFGELDYRQILQSSLETRRTLNAHYSARAFSRDIKIASSQLSQILNRKRGLSPVRARSTGKNLGLTASEQDYFYYLVMSEHARSKRSRQAAKAKIADFNSNKNSNLRSTELNDDLFQYMSEWYHCAILECLKIKRAQWTPVLLAKALDLNENTVGMALVRLERLQLIHRTPEGLKLAQDSVMRVDQVPGSASRAFHSQVMARAIDAIQNQKIEERYFRTEFMPIRAKDIAKAQADISLFFKEFVKKYSNGNDDAEVYSLGLQLYRQGAKST